jgi:hypothetical protein
MLCVRCKLKGLNTSKHHQISGKKPKTNYKWEVQKQCSIEALACPCKHLRVRQIIIGLHCHHARKFLVQQFQWIVFLTFTLFILQEKQVEGSKID